ncbi:hypothetical protein G9A89_010246 [Geosiphon pyriformis]|nr:hypothetical protein G9A89_010246 [Geosiphon pyriformis]
MKSKKQFNIQVPFPPEITAQDLVQKKLLKNIYTKAPNAYIIYRGQYLEQFNKHGIKKNLDDLSQESSSAWYDEPEKVKVFYRNLGKEVTNLLEKNRISSKNFVEQDWNEYGKNNRKNDERGIKKKVKSKSKSLPKRSLKEKIVNSEKPEISIKPNNLPKEQEEGILNNDDLNQDFLNPQPLDDHTIMDLTSLTTDELILLSQISNCLY